MAEVSVVIPTFNRARKVCRAVSSVLYQTSADLEVMVVDDGSTDGTQDHLRGFGDRIHRIAHPVNRGVSAARNTGIRASTAPLIAFLDSDDYWLPQKTELQADFFEAHPEAVACQTDEIWIRKGRFANPMKKHRKPSGDIFGPSLRICLISPSAVMLRRGVLEEVGLFDETLPACEDYDLWLRIASRYPVEHIPRPLVIKEGGHPDQLSAQYKGMDRFRIAALVKLLLSGCLQEGQSIEALYELTHKCRIYGQGCGKRGRMAEGRFFQGLPGRVQQGLREREPQQDLPLIRQTLLEQIREMAGTADG